MKIKDVGITEIFDSRGEATIEISVTDAEGRSFCAQLPSGKSRGENEVCVLTFAEAGKVIMDVIRPALVGKDISSVTDIDGILLSLDTSSQKKKIGGNVSLGISIACVRAIAHERNTEVWRVVNDEFFEGKIYDKIPKIYSNFINGGRHARNNLSIQEYLVIAETDKNIFGTIHRLIELYKDIGDTIRERSGVTHMPIGDEGGYSHDFKNNFEPLELLSERINGEGLDKHFRLGIDAAATSFLKNGKYFFDNEYISEAELMNKYVSYAEKIGIFESIEDPFMESDVSAFKYINERLPKVTIVGDDLTTTDAIAIEKMARNGSVGGVIIKPNQIGTISETCKAIKVARDNDCTVIISHRSGESEDVFIIQLAKACGADGVKIGAPVHERIYKFNEMIRLFS
jgi:enolase